MDYRISYQGIAGSYSEQALQEFCGKNSISPVPISTHFFSELFESIENHTFLGFIPIENSTTGSVIQAQDLLLQYQNLRIIGEYIMAIDHCLAGNLNSTLENISGVYSHPQALSQCKSFLDLHSLHGYSFTDTAGAAQFVAKEQNKSLAAICSTRAASLYGLNILRENIQDKTGNTTRFLLVKHKDSSFDFEQKLPQPNKTSLAFEGRSIPAHLYKCLGGFATNNINLLRLESRPHPDKQFEYVFHLDLEGPLEDAQTQNAIEELRYFSKMVHIFGEYPAYKKVDLQ